MTEVWLKVPGDEGGYSQTKLQHKVTSVPQIRKVAGAKFIPTKFAARHDHMWRRIWERADGTFYIKTAYRHMDVLIEGN